MGEERARRLERERLGVEVVAEDAEEEDGGGEGVAAVVGVASSEAGEKLVIELWSGDVSVRRWRGRSSWEDNGETEESRAYLGELRCSRRAGSGGDVVSRLG